MSVGIKLKLCIYGAVLDSFLILAVRCFMMLDNATQWESLFSRHPALWSRGYIHRSLILIVGPSAWEMLGNVQKKVQVYLVLFCAVSLFLKSWVGGVVMCV